MKINFRIILATAAPLILAATAASAASWLEAGAFLSSVATGIAGTLGGHLSTTLSSTLK